VEKAKRAIPAVCGLIGLLAGCIAAYFVLAFLWTRLIVSPAEVTGRDTDIVFALSVIAGIITGSLALLYSAPRYWNSHHRTLHRHVR
jgi:nitrate reductase gamma subunit